MARGGADLVEALRVAVGLHDVRHPAVALTARASQRRVGAPADPDRRKLLHGLGIDRDRLEAREAPVEARRRVAPERAHRVDPLVHAGAALLVRNAAELELLRILAADADAEHEPAAREHVERRRLLGGHRRRAQRQEIDADAELDPPRDRHVGRQEGDRLVDRVVEGHVVAGPHRVVADRFEALDELELLGRRMERRAGRRNRSCRHLGKASRTPPSTVTEQPVVLAERSDARKSTASATSSGKMLTPRRLRLR